jgi:hypothetical protein
MASRLGLGRDHRDVIALIPVDADRESVGNSRIAFGMAGDGGYKLICAVFGRGKCVDAVAEPVK